MNGKVTKNVPVFFLYAALNKSIDYNVKRLWLELTTSLTVLTVFCQRITILATQQIRFSKEPLRTISTVSCLFVLVEETKMHLDS